MAESFNVIEKYKLRCAAVTPLHIGTGEGEQGEILIHPVTDKPFVQASGIAGALRNVSDTINGSAITDGLFGTSLREKSENKKEVESRAKICDGEFDASTLKLELRPRVSIDPKSGTVSASTIGGSGRSSGHKFETEMIGRGAEFDVLMYLYHMSDDNYKTALENVLSEIKAEHLQIGGQKSNGSGVLRLLSLKHISFDMRIPGDRKQWSKEQRMDEPGHQGLPKYEDIFNKLPKVENPFKAYEIEVVGRTEGTLLVKAASTMAFGKGAADAENIRDSQGEYIIPGSSIKGAIRGRIRQLANMMDKTGVVTYLMGKEQEDAGKGAKGIISVRDAIIGDQNSDVKTLLQHRIHIDKFTGGVIQTGLFTEESVSGKIVIQIDVENRKEPDAALGLLILTIRDLAAGAFNLGSGYSIGRGFIKVEKMHILSTRDGREAKIDFLKSEIQDDNELISTGLQAVSEWQEQNLE